MFGILDDMMLGREIEAHGKKWQVIKPLSSGYYIAIEKGQTLPCVPHIVCVDKEFEEYQKRIKLHEDLLRKYHWTCNSCGITWQYEKRGRPCPDCYSENVTMGKPVDG